MVDQCAQVSCGSGSWMNGSFDSDQPKEATRKAACGQDSTLLELGYIFFPPSQRENASESKGRNGLVKIFHENLCLLGLKEKSDSKAGKLLTPTFPLLYEGLTAPAINLISLSWSLCVCNSCSWWDMMRCRRNPALVRKFTCVRQKCGG